MSSSRSSSIRLGARTGGRQAPRRESLLSLRFGWIEFAAMVLGAIYVGAAVYLVGRLGLTSSEAIARTAHAATLWDGFDVTMLAFGFDRPPLLNVLTIPFAAFDGLREHGLAEVATHVALGDVAACLGELAEQQRAPLIVVGSRKLGPLTRLFVASVASELAATARCAVAVVPPDYHPA